VTPLTILETPGAATDLYTAVNEEAAELRFRPLFTGDVLELSDRTCVALMQHPCSMRRGTSLNPNLLFAKVIRLGRKYRSDWSTAPFDLCYLPTLSEDYPAVDFHGIGTITADCAQEARRVAIVSLYGATVLMQRWIHFSTRLVVPIAGLA
jgi:hypothetical protein